MSFQNSSQQENNTKQLVEIKVRSKSAFENHMMQCLKMPEYQLRHWLRKILIQAGFEIFEDGYESDRCKDEPKYKTVHNMLCIRGNKPAICLVAHTDVCRDHEGASSRGTEYWMQGRHMTPEDKAKLSPIVVQPVIKEFYDTDGAFRRIIQDKNCAIQVGGDDRLGVAINTWVALNTNFNMGLLFVTDEEIGLKSARVANFEQFKDFELFFQIDRGNNDRGAELVTKISGKILVDYDTTVDLLDIAFKGGVPRNVVTGMHTDIYALMDRGVIKRAVNLTCGYHNSRGSDPTEYIDIEEAKDTLQYANDVVEFYNAKYPAVS